MKCSFMSRTFLSEWKKAKTNSEPQSEVMCEGTPCLEKTWRTNNLANIGDVCWGTYAYMHICTKSIQIYFGISFDFILVLLSFHCSHTVPIFSEFFPIFLAVLFTSKACHFDTALLIFASV